MRAEEDGTGRIEISEWRTEQGRRVAEAAGKVKAQKPEVRSGETRENGDGRIANASGDWQIGVRMQKAEIRSENGEGRRMQDARCGMGIQDSECGMQDAGCGARRSKGETLTWLGSIWSVAWS